jgi:hypothetical protein
LIYTSFRKPNCYESEIKKILEACQKNNPGHEITGILLHSKNRFIQYIEGEPDKLLSLYDKIKEDNRHTSVNQRSFMPIEKRLFPAWHMGYKDVISDQIGFHTAISEDDREIFESMITGKNEFNDHGLTVLKLFFEMA